MGVQRLRKVLCLASAMAAATLLAAESPSPNSSPAPTPDQPAKTSLHALGLIPAPPSQAARAAAVLQEIRQRRAKAAHVLELPTAVDNSAGLPPVGDQGGQGSCVSWAVGYYAKSYQEGKERGWNLTEPAHQFSPAFLYNQLQYSDEGSTFEDNLALLVDQGCASLATMPFDEGDHRTWPSKESYREGLPYRAASWDYLGNGQTPQVFAAVKAIVADGGVCNVGMPIYRRSAAVTGSFDDLCPTNFHYFMPASDDRYVAGSHALTIVGYDESKFNGQGGYRVVNQWGTDWGANGFAWLSEPFLTTYGLYFYRMTDRVGYQPTQFVRFKVSHTAWWTDSVAITIGVGPTAAPFWSKSMNNRIERDALTLDRWADITEAAAYLPPSSTNRWWIRIKDHYEEDNGTLSLFDIEAVSQVFSAAAVLPFDTSLYDGASDKSAYAYLPCGPATAAAYYVNDDSPTGDIYCTALGDDRNDGLSPATPKSTLQAVVAAYTLKGGDTVWIDTGTYRTAGEWCVDYLDHGQAGNPIRFVGSTNADGTTLATPSGGGTVLRIVNSEHLLFENLALTGGATGIQCEGTQYAWYHQGDSDITFRNMHVSGASQNACYLLEAHGAVFDRCILEGGASSCLYLQASDAWVSRSTLYAQGSASCISGNSGLADYISTTSVTVSNSILSAQNGRCFRDYGYSTIYPAFCAAFVSGSGEHGFAPGADCLTLDPLFADPANGDFHLKSAGGRWDPAANAGAGEWVTDSETSPCIDAGDIDSDYASEPSPNGSRINMGAYGNTPWASQSPPLRILRLDAPKSGGHYLGACVIAWTARQTGWGANDTLLAEYSQDGGQTYEVVPGGEALTYWASSFVWDTRTLPPGSNYVLRLTCNQAGGTSVTHAGTFSIGAMQSYYVNDAFDSLNDVYCIAPGNDGNDGLTPVTPKASIQAIVDAYTLAPGDVVYVDTGSYTPASNIVIGAADSGSATAAVSFVGSTNPLGTTINRGLATNGCYGIQLNGCAYVTLDRLTIAGAYGAVHANGATGCSVKRCRLEGCTIGFLVSGGGGNSVSNTVFGRNSYGVMLSQWGGSLAIVNNTFHSNVTASIHLSPKSGYNGFAANPLTVRNNVFWQPSGHCIYSDNSWKILPCDYNNFFLCGSGAVGYWPTRGTFAGLRDWQAGMAMDAHSIAADPLFADAANGDYHEMSTGGRWSPTTRSWTNDAVDGPCIDAGDPADPVGSEPSPNAGRRNLGAYGGTAEASKSRPHRYLCLLAPAGGERWTGLRQVLWTVDRSGWQPADTVRLDYSSDGGSSWRPVMEAQAIPFDRCTWTWDTRQATNSPRSRLRMTFNRDGSVADASRSDFVIANTGILYYVNDAYDATNDVYCTAAGDNGNDGLTPATPKASIQAVVDAYLLGPGDVVYVDTGRYTPVSNIVVGVDDSGSTNGCVSFVGSPNPAGTLIDRGDASNACGIHLNGCAYVNLDRLNITRAYHAVYAVGATGCTVQRCRLTACTNGVQAANGTGYTVRNNIIANNTRGVLLNPWGAGSLSVVNNTFVNNGMAAIQISAGVNSATIHPVEVRNNVFCQSSGSCIYNASDWKFAPSDYNDFFLSGSGKVGYWHPSGVFTTLENWQTARGLDTHSIASDPQFADPANGDYHEKSTGGRWNPLTRAWTNDAVDGPCIDAGDPADPVGSEPSPHSGRINLGAYGGTAEASKSRPHRYLCLLAPAGGERWTGLRQVLWTVDRSGWQPADTVRLDYSSDGGSSWHPITEAQMLPYDRCAWTWDTQRATNSPRSRLRLTCNRDGNVFDASRSDFVIANTGIAYYVNDVFDSTNDVYCTAAGDDGNDGLTSATPKASIQAVLDTYWLGPGDIVFVDTGTYTPSNTIVIGAADSGSTNGYVALMGSPNPMGTLFDYGNRTNAVHGIQLTGCSRVKLDRLSVSRAYSAVVAAGADDCLVQRCYLTACTNGFQASGGSGCEVRNNVIAGNGRGVFLTTWGNNDSLSIVNNTFASNVTAALDIRPGFNGGSGGYPLTVRNNVFWQPSGYCFYSDSNWRVAPFDYNCFFLTGSGRLGSWYSYGVFTNLASWQTGFTTDPHSLEADPQFAAPQIGDYHVKSTGGRWNPATRSWTNDVTDSPCVDAGYPADPVGAEPLPNALRINLGAYGGTAEASKSRGTRLLTVTSPNGGEVWRGVRTITWQRTREAWQETDTVSLDYSTNNGGTWAAIPGATAIAARHEGFEWDLQGLPVGTQYLVRAVCDQDAGVWDDSDQAFAVQTGGVFFVNDAFTNGDRYCTAVGTNANDGLTPATPKDSVSAILQAYDLGTGDVIHVDSGVYDLVTNIVVDPSDGGSVSDPVRIVGVRGKTVIRRNAPGASGSRCFGIYADYVSLENLTLQSAEVGVSLSLRSAFDGPRECQIKNCRFEGHGLYAVCLSACVVDTRIENNTIQHNGSGPAIYLDVNHNFAPNMPCVILNNTIVANKGINIEAESGPLLRGNIIVATGAAGYCFQAYVWWGHTADYNDFLALSGAVVNQGTLTDWVTLSGQDVHSVSVDPLFADSTNGDFHLLSVAGRWDPTAGGGQGGWTNDLVTSPCIDAGDPGSDYSQEPAPNGWRINLGADANTVEASKMPARWLVFNGAGLSQPLSAWAPLYWTARGLGWGTGETVRLECGTNGGTSWSPIATATNLACGARLFWWDTLSVPNGTGYSFRVVSESTPTLVSAPDGSYQIDNNRYAPALAWTGDPGFETNGVEPDLGLDVTNFVFEVTYSDGDNHAPASGFPRLRIMKGSAEIAGSPFAMTEVSVAETNHAAGKRYKSAALTLAAGSDYTYGFEAQDTHAAPAASADPVSAHSGPVVTKTARLRVASTYGGITLPLGTNVCVAGSLIACSVTNSPVTMGLTQYVCTGWAGTGSVTNGAATNAVFTLNEDGGVTWLWQTNYSLAVTTNGQGTADPAQVWVPSGSTTTVTATAAAHWHLDRWGGDIDGCIISSNRIVVVADRPRAMTALFAIDQHTFTMISPYAGMRTRTSPEFRMTIGFPGYNKDETLTNFPALVVLSTNIPGFNYAEVASTNGGNLLFRDATGLLELNYEIEKWNTNGSSYIWVQLPTLASSNDFIELSWLKNGPALRGGLTAKATWEDGFSGVWHLSESPTNAAPQMRDSTAMTNHASCRSMIDSDQTAGRIGGAVSLNGNSKYMDCGNALSLQNSAGTMEAWIMTSANDTTYRAIVCKQSAYGMFVRNRKLLVYDWGNNATRDTGAVVADGTWHHVAFSYRNNVTNGTSVYVDGSKKLDCLVKIDGQTTGEFIGYGNSPNQYHSGLIDEVRASAVYRSGNWLWATWMNAASNSQFNSYGEVQTPYAMTDGTVTFVATNFAYGTELTCAITNSPVSGQGTQYVGTGWILAGVSDTHGSSSGEGTNMTLLLTNNTILTWQWQTNFWLAASNSGPGWVAATNGWLPYGFHTNAVAVPSNYYHFVLWTGTVNSASNPLPLTMDQAHNLAALFAENVATQGTPEWWLAHYGWTSDFNAAATNDADHDGLLNWQEWVAGTDPTNPASALRVLSLTSATNGMRIGWQGGTSVWQYLERSTGLGSGLPWTVIFSNGPVAAASTNFLDTATTNTPSFYRIKAVR